MDNYDELKESLQKMVKLLEDPQEGLMSWQQFLYERRNELLRLLGVKTELAEAFSEGMKKGKEKENYLLFGHTYPIKKDSVYEREYLETLKGRLI